VTYTLTWSLMAETPFVSKLKTYQNSIRTNGPQDFSLGMMKAHDVFYERIFLFSLCGNPNKSYREKTEDTLARKPPC
jgi:hypothetical protein